MIRPGVYITRQTLDTNTVRSSQTTDSHKHMELHCIPNPFHSKTNVLQTISEESMFYRDSSSREK